ncbi:metal ABC transporter permease [Aureimonas populi]|uniref:High-affinity zinc uptake system membrane protein ZnuB n=1 Tax=Aureimonas populi TaxID=1701758 RepID=A0ABW5CHH6_9HYPH|nr:metal ABC transporter permease [Aureimonas populi]
MFAEFFLRALAAGMGVAVIAGPLGCFVVWRRMAYFGETIAHASLLGVGLSLLTGLPPAATIFATALAFAGLLAALERVGGYSTDSLLGILSYSALSLGVVVASSMPGVRVDLSSLLFGDILAVAWGDVVLIAVAGVAILSLLAFFWRDLIASTVSPEIAAAEGRRPEAMRLLLLVLVAALVAVAIKIVGVLLVTAMLVIPAAAARRLSANPERMALASACIGVAAVLAGLMGSLAFDTPPGPAIVVAALTAFLAGLALPGGRERRAAS